MLDFSDTNIRAVVEIFAYTTTSTKQVPVLLHCCCLVGVRHLVTITRHLSITFERDGDGVGVDGPSTTPHETIENFTSTTDTPSVVVHPVHARAIQGAKSSGGVTVATTTDFPASVTRIRGRGGHKPLSKLCLQTQFAGVRNRLGHDRSVNTKLYQI